MSEQDANSLSANTPECSSQELPTVNQVNRTPQILRREQVALYRQKLYAEFNPVGFTEIVIVNDLARRAAALEFLEEAIGAVQRESARGFVDLGLVRDDDDSDAADAALVGAVSAGRLDECERRSLGSARAFFRALSVVRELQAARTKASNSTADTADERFSTETACAAYLCERFKRRDPPCQRCGMTSKHWLPSRRCWECKYCKFQKGVRVGTVMERSPLPLTKWFAAIRFLLLQPTITTAELAEQIDVQRLATVRSMSNRIREAMTSDDASKLLVDLDTVYSRIA